MRLRGVFRAAKLPNGQQAIGTKWVFKIKRKADGSIEKYKARLVAEGFKQKYGIDYTETYWKVRILNTVKLDEAEGRQHSGRDRSGCWKPLEGKNEDSKVID
ncbi:unnamed protein product [Phytophthora lilii]|uniref:Unnamed protein product n=1 Tax=Phytophthora lilii TaxID=2077276 RepID=A0A9W6Y749_9STRA|nr:unnamed protein product [Phytophthora lilii]